MRVKLLVLAGVFLSTLGISVAYALSAGEEFDWLASDTGIYVGGTGSSLPDDNRVQFLTTGVTEALAGHLTLQARGSTSNARMISQAGNSYVEAQSTGNVFIKSRTYVVNPPPHHGNTPTYASVLVQDDGDAQLINRGASSVVQADQFGSASLLGKAPGGDDGELVGVNGGAVVSAQADGDATMISRANASVTVTDEGDVVIQLGTSQQSKSMKSSESVDEEEVNYSTAALDGIDETGVDPTGSDRTYDQQISDIQDVLNSMNVDSGLDPE